MTKEEFRNSLYELEPDDTEFDGERHTSHFLTCTAPGRFSKGRRA